MLPQLSLSVNNLSDFDLYQQAIEDSHLSLPLPFVEILWDNYCHVEPELLQQYLSRFSDRVAFHIMWSKFLELDVVDLAAFFQRLRQHIQVIQPLYVSDHLCRFQLGGTHLFQAIEIGYTDLDAVCRRVDLYQSRLGIRLLLENHASTNLQGCHQIEFFEALINRTGCGVFFDLSNARVADKNGITPFTDWLDLLDRLPAPLHCHVGSYSQDPQTGVYYDTHNRQVSPETLADIATVSSRLKVETICYEREFDRTSQAMSEDLNSIRASIIEVSV